MRDNLEVNAVKGLQGEIFIPGDKSISHRSVMFSSLGDKAVTIKNFLNSQDCLSTVSCMEALGVKIEKINDNELVVHGVGINGLKEPENVLDAGNSGTTLRLLMGMLSAQNFFVTFLCFLKGETTFHVKLHSFVLKIPTKESFYNLTKGN